MQGACRTLGAGLVCTVAGCRAPVAVVDAPAAVGAAGQDGGGGAGFLEEGLSFDDPLLEPGKLDLLFRTRSEVGESNLMWWSPVVKAGAGRIDPDGADPTTYAGGYVRPLQAFEGAGELIVGALEVEDAAGESSEELQAEYRFPFGLGVGAGTVDRPDAAPDVRFAKVTYRDRLGDVHLVLEGQVQETGDETEPGGYAGLHDEVWLGVVGHDGEQWRATLNYIAPESDGLLRPAIEGLYVDSSVGALDGPKLLFVNGTLKFRGGFLSHPASLGRAMGPQGLEYGNPLGFLQPTWNRRLDTWELGGVVDLRLVHTELPDGETVADYEVLAYPWQVSEVEGPLGAVLVGGFRSERPDEDTEGVLVGYSGGAGFLQLSVTVHWEVDTGDLAAVVGLIDWF